MANKTFDPRYEPLRQRLVELREKSGLTQVELAARLGKPQSYVSKYERGERRLDLIDLFEITSALEQEAVSLVADFHRVWMAVRTAG